MLLKSNRFRGKKQCFYEWIAFILPPILMFGVCFTMLSYPLRANPIVAFMILIGWLTALKIAYYRWKILYNMKARLKHARIIKKYKYVEKICDFSRATNGLKFSTIFPLIYGIYAGFSLEIVRIFLFMVLLSVISHLMLIKITKNQRERYITWRNIFCLFGLLSLIFVHTAFVIIFL